MSIIIPEDRGHSYSEEFRHECEVKHMSTKMDRDQRIKHVKGVEKIRGIVAKDRLVKDVTEYMAKMRG